MISVQKAIFPGIALGCVFLVLISSLIANPHVALASYREDTVAAVSADQPAADSADQNPAPVEQASEQAVVAAQDTQSASVEPQPEEEAPAVEPPAESSSPDSSCSVSSAYPEKIRQWCDLIERHAGEHSMDPNLIAAVMLQESGGNPDAYSKSGAVGLMQVMPRDGIAAGFTCVNGPCFASRPSMAELYDPEFNISYGTRMLAGLINKYGDVREALRAYGPMNMGYRYADIVLGHLNQYR